jgi:hypothetical protein
MRLLNVYYVYESGSDTAIAWVPSRVCLRHTRLGVCGKHTRLGTQLTAYTRV